MDTISTLKEGETVIRVRASVESVAVERQYLSGGKVHWDPACRSSTPESRALRAAVLALVRTAAQAELFHSS